MSGIIETVDQLVGPTAIAYVAGETIGTTNYILAMSGASALIGGAMGYAIGEMNKFECAQDPLACDGFFGLDQTELTIGGAVVGGAAGTLSGFTYSALAEATSKIIK